MLDQWMRNRRGVAVDVTFCDGPLGAAAFESIKAWSRDGAAGLIRFAMEDLARCIMKMFGGWVSTDEGSKRHVQRVHVRSVSVD